MIALVWSFHFSILVSCLCFTAFFIFVVDFFVFTAFSLFSY